MVLVARQLITMCNYLPNWLGTGTGLLSDLCSISSAPGRHSGVCVAYDPYERLRPKTENTFIPSRSPAVRERSNKGLASVIRFVSTIVTLVLVPVTVLSALILVVAGTFLILYIITIKELHIIFIPNKSLAIVSFRFSSIISKT
jgi:hypothetical protein